MEEQVTKLGMAKVYFTKEDFGKMLKLKDPTNLEIIDVEKDEDGDIIIKLVTTMDNVVNNRVKPIEDIKSKCRQKVNIEFEN